MKPIYHVPVIPNNLRHRETFIQIADALNYLNLVFDDVLIKVNNRINDKQKQLSVIRGRITTVHQKVQNITKTKKATQIFSNSKYPVSKNIDLYKSIFSTETTMELRKTQLKLKEPQITEQSNNILQFYHVKVKKDTGGSKHSTITGLGKCPSNTQIVNELLLFNTHKNPYENYEMLDPLSNTIESIRLTDENNVNGPDAAPLSMTQRNGTAREVKDNYFYSPDLGEVPTIDVPLDLPDLPGVANDLRYVMEYGPGIAPSVTTTPIMPDLPQITPAEPLPEPQILNSTIVSGTIRSNVQPEEFPMDLPDHLPELPVTNEQVFTAAIPSLPVVEHEEQKTENSNMNTRPASINVQNSEVSTDARASLMEAIRQAGKKTLHSVKTEPEKIKPKVNVGNDLMADLHNKLAMRRKGISGNKTVEGGLEVSSAMNRVSAMIPPPMPLSNNAAESTTTEDEDNDWDE